jgi:hypothetical protein
MLPVWSLSQNLPVLDLVSLLPEEYANTILHFSLPVGILLASESTKGRVDYGWRSLDSWSHRTSELLPLVTQRTEGIS